MPGWSARQGVLTGGSVVLSVVLGAWLGLPDLWWAAISAWVVSNPDFHALWAKLWRRMAGTAIGLIIGYEVAVAIEGLILFQLLTLFAAFAIGTYKRFSSVYGYAWLYGSITIALIIAVSIQTPDQLFSFAEFRMLEITLGVFSSSFVHAIGRAGSSSAPPPAPPSGPNPELMRLSMVAAFSGVGLAAIWASAAIPALPQALLTTQVVIDRDIGSLRVKARQRFLGCVFGASLGLLALQVDMNTLPVYSVVLFSGIFYFSRLHFGGGPRSYIGTQGGMAYITTLVTGGGPPHLLGPIFERLAGIFAGVILMILISYIMAALAGREPSEAERERVVTT